MIQYILWPYLLFGVIAFIVTFKVPDVKVDSEPLQFSDIKKLLTTKPYFIFLILMLFITVTHRANDSFIGLYIAQLGGTESLVGVGWLDRKSTRLNSSHVAISYAVFCLKKKKRRKTLRGQGPNR